MSGRGLGWREETLVIITETASAALDKAYPAAGFLAKIFLWIDWFTSRQSSACKSVVRGFTSTSPANWFALVLLQLS